MIGIYCADDRMIDLIEGNYRLLQVMSRFGLSLGFGDLTVGEVCERHGVDPVTFLAVINFVHSGYTRLVDEPEKLSVTTLMDYLRHSHGYFLDFVFPRIHRDLHEAVRHDDDKSIPAIIHKQLADYILSDTRHMRHEEATLFPYVEGLMRGESDKGFELSAFSRNHVPLDDSLRELKRILIQYNPDCANVNELNAVLYQIYCCEDELDSHCRIEDYIFVPAVYHLEERLRHENS